MKFIAPLAFVAAMAASVLGQSVQFGAPENGAPVSARTNTLHILLECLSRTVPITTCYSDLDGIAPDLVPTLDHPVTFHHLAAPHGVLAVHSLQSTNYRVFETRGLSATNAIQGSIRRPLLEARVEFDRQGCPSPAAVSASCSYLKIITVLNYHCAYLRFITSNLHAGSRSPAVHRQALSTFRPSRMEKV
ncbi:hypothetical protein K435DRAFT_880479 [Dendrothele bispora CBS 962.96]|uniref:Uncharacterized protein n=1 Tax=Dendrothele bispora (strain CBS 962.96) TaxID=1314807 RepID=A0A4S8KJH9_DENBC|nr:hypothetical protein K435DRAFT_880479 [Dendrothele bispora CBS 962.96]